MKLCLGCMEQMEDSVTTCPHCGFNEVTFTQESYYLTRVRLLEENISSEK